jgi:15-cis-phytoene synthase
VGVARTKLAWWRTEVANLFAGHPQHPVTQALAPFVETLGIDAARMNEIIDGMEMDLAYHRYPDFESLRLYCHRAAGVVGQLSASIFGYANPATLEYAENLGIAFQLTNIIRDVGEDARRGRVYLPQDELARFGLTAEDILARKGGEPFVKLMRFQAERAQSYYDLAFSKLAPEDRASQRAGLIMAGIYRTLLDEISRDGFQVLEQRVTLTPLRKLWIAWKTWVKG